MNFFKNDHLRNCRLFAVFRVSKKKFHDPEHFLKVAFATEHSAYRLGRQEDLHEFSLHLLTLLNQALLLDKTTAISHPASQRLASEADNEGNQDSSTEAESDAPKAVAVSQFYGTMLVKKSSAEENGEEIRSSSREEFQRIMLDVNGFDTLYSCLDAYTAPCTVQYITPLNYNTTAVSESCIDQLPYVLSFQLKRVVFDSVFSRSVKLDHVVKFDQQIFMDRYLVKNSAKVARSREEIKVLSEKISQIDQEINRLNPKDDDDSCSMERHIEKTITFLSDPDYANMCPQPAAAVLAEQLKEMVLKFQNRLNELRENKEEIKSQLAALCNHPDFQRHKYELQAIFMHSGVADAGHYTSYVRDLVHDKWFSCNDITVDPINSSRIFDRYDLENVCGLVYVACDAPSNVAKIPITDLSQKLRDFASKEEYYQPKRTVLVKNETTACLSNDPRKKLEELIASASAL